MTIKEVYAEYTGGGIWLFRGSLDDGDYFMVDDYGDVLIVDADPAQYGDEPYYEEWQREHFVRELYDDRRCNFVDEMCSILKSYEYGDAHRGGIEDYIIEQFSKTM